MLWIIILFILLLIIDFQLGRFLVSKRNKSQSWRTTTEEVEMFADGNPLFEAMLSDIEKAKESIDIQFFIIRNDRISNQFYTLLARKHAEGVQVRLLADWVGSFKFRKKWLNQKFFMDKMNPPRFPFFYHFQQRSHRKVLVIDQKISYFGGFNLGNEYVGKDVKLGRWRDYHYRMVGKIGEVMQESFTNDWGIANNRPIPQIGDIRVLATEGDVLEKEMLDYIKKAKESIEIGSPYFIPTQKLAQALLDALAKDVDVTIMIPDKSDHVVAKAAALPYLRKLKEHGATIYLYVDGFFHAKVLFFDRKICDTGTANFDRRSLQLNQELNLFVGHEHPIYKKTRKTFDTDISTCKKMTDTWLNHQPLYIRILSWISIPFRIFL
ncbi:cardiolipin synthase [Gracilibacillus orientalis]|uniref:Cardiolipin synthase n=1 Tax=Gracilibacillus orientalis TaxID=334253 RepID=A0A1I4NPL3_9BACI|nr:phospholipase D-like domain-containing protein [Gracilibacillus orientalis]SFM17376.1 cardiolipin synthase [Gracilibacillus orientalis]